MLRTTPTTQCDGPVMAKISGSDVRPGMVIEHEGSLWVAVKSGAVKPGKGPAYNQVELKNILDGRKLNQRFGGSDRVEETEVERRQFQFLYKQGEQLVFMDTTSYEQIELGEDFVGDRSTFLQDGMMVQVQLHGDRPSASSCRRPWCSKWSKPTPTSRARPRPRPTSPPSSTTAFACWCRRSSRSARRSWSRPTRSPT